MFLEYVKKGNGGSFFGYSGIKKSSSEQNRILYNPNTTWIHFLTRWKVMDLSSPLSKLQKLYQRRNNSLYHHVTGTTITVQI